MSRFLWWCEEKGYKCEVNLPPESLVKQWVEEESEEAGRELAKEILDREGVDVCSRIDEALAEYEDRIFEEVDVRLTYTTDNLLVADAFEGIYSVSGDFDSLSEFVQAYAYHVWSDEIYRKTKKILEDLCIGSLLLFQIES